VATISATRPKGAEQYSELPPDAELGTNVVPLGHRPNVPESGLVLLSGPC
jgi:hypothetical protein